MNPPRNPPITKPPTTVEELENEMNNLENINSKDILNVEFSNAKIQIMHSTFPLHSIIPILQEIPDETLKNDINQIIDEINTMNNNSARDKIRKLAVKYQPKSINNLIWLYKLGTMEFFIDGSTFDLNVLNILNDIFKIKIDFDNNPLHIHLITKELMMVDCLKNSIRNKIYYAKTISTLSKFALYISICIIWSVFFSIVGLNEQKMYRFHKFSELIQIIKNLDINEFKNKENDFYILLECISYLLNVTTAGSSTFKVDSCFLDYFKYNKSNIKVLKTWCTSANRNFVLRASDNNFSLDHSLISDLLELDILVVLENLDAVDED